MVECVIVVCSLSASLQGQRLIVRRIERGAPRRQKGFLYLYSLADARGVCVIEVGCASVRSSGLVTDSPLMLSPANIWSRKMRQDREV